MRVRYENNNNTENEQSILLTTPLYSTGTIPRVIVISALVQSSTSITVKWMSYTVVTVSSYKICLKTEIGSGVDCIRDINSTQTELLVENLIPNTRYEISVFAFTSIGVTPMSNILVATTSGLF